MTCKEILNDAKKLIGGSRQKDYGDKLTNHQNIAALWSVFLQVNITAHDAAVCMALVKIARLMHQHKKDSYIDLAAYASIAGEIEERTNKKNISFEGEGERRGRITKEYVKSLNKVMDKLEEK